MSAERAAAASRTAPASISTQTATSAGGTSHQRMGTWRRILTTDRRTRHQAWTCTSDDHLVRRAQDTAPGIQDCASHLTRNTRSRTWHKYKRAAFSSTLQMVARRTHSRSSEIQMQTEPGKTEQPAPSMSARKTADVMKTASDSTSTHRATDVGSTLIRTILNQTSGTMLRESTCM